MPIEIRELVIKTQQATIQTLEQRVALLERALQVTNEKVTLMCGSASIELTGTGNVTVSGREINMTATGKVQVKASSDLVLKGAKIQQN